MAGSNTQSNENYKFATPKGNVNEKGLKGRNSKHDNIYEKRLLEIEKELNEYYIVNFQQ